MSETEAKTGRRSGRARLRRFEIGLQERALAVLGLQPSEREKVVALMLERRRDTVGYWFQLLLSAGIATLGLVLGSSAVVIGAMLIAPLMGPIVELGMALVIGSPALTLRSLLRTLSSVAAVVGLAALLTLLLPFTEITPEVASRTVPTALDLLVAIFVALVAVFTTVRSTSETTSAAAGTAIGIALVPPVCVIGFGVGIADASVAGGATLLFVTNLTAILFMSVICFWMLGFEHVDAKEWERAELAEARPGSLSARSMAWLDRVFGSRHGFAIRAGIPALLILVTYFPLSAALDQVGWEVRTRTAVNRIIGAALEGRSAVQSATTVAGRSVRAELYVVGGPAAAAELQDELRTRIAAETGVIPTLSVIAVPDLDAVRSMAGAAPAPRAEAPPTTRLGAIRDAADEAVRALWPAEMGRLLGWRLVMGDSARLPVVEVFYVGEPAGRGIEALFARALSERLSAPVEVRGVGLAAEGAAAPLAQGVEWLPEFLRAARQAAALPGMHTCATVPEARTAAERVQVARVAPLVVGEAAEHARTRIDTAGREWRVALRTGGCALPAPPPDEDAAAG